MIGSVYILKDSDGMYYIGSTSDVSRRLRQHIVGHTQTTRRMNNPKLVFYQEYPSLVIARKIEKKLKKLKRKDFIDRIIIDKNIKIKV